MAKRRITVRRVIGGTIATVGAVVTGRFLLRRGSNCRDLLGETFPAIADQVCPPRRKERGLRISTLIRRRLPTADDFAIVKRQQSFAKGFGFAIGTSRAGARARSRTILGPAVRALRQRLGLTIK